MTEYQKKHMFDRREGAGSMSFDAQTPEERRIVALEQRIVELEMALEAEKMADESATLDLRRLREESTD